ncbi:MAG TPA: deoxyribose-phosphate aldolase, partial [Kofleriaceae bacterium]
AREIDMVINIGALKSRDYETVFEDICRVVKSAAPAGVKVILETSALDEEQKIIGCAMAKLAGAAFVKTSTGFGKGGATVEDVQLMRRIVGGDIGVKASGGVRTAEDVIKMAQAGANRIGASASVAIVSGDGGKEAAAKHKGY